MSFFCREWPSVYDGRCGPAYCTVFSSFTFVDSPSSSTCGLCRMSRRCLRELTVRVQSTRILVNWFTLTSSKNDHERPIALKIVDFFGLWFVCLLFFFPCRLCSFVSVFKDLRSPGVDSTFLLHLRMFLRQFQVKFRQLIVLNFDFDVTLHRIFHVFDEVFILVF